MALSERWRRMSEAGYFDRPGLHVIATDVDVDDVADLLARLSISVDAVADGYPSFSPYQNAAENLFLGHEPRRFGLVDRGRMRREAARIFALFGLDVAPDEPLALRSEDQLLFALAKVAIQRPSVCAVNADRLHIASDSTIRALNHLISIGVSVVLAGAAVGDLLTRASTITVVLLGSGDARVAGACDPGPQAFDSVVSLLSTGLAGRDVAAARSCERPDREAEGVSDTYPIFSVSEWTIAAMPALAHPVAARVSFDVRGGEIVALSGYGSRELALSLFGSSMGPAISGQVVLKRSSDGPSTDVSSLTASQAISAGISYGSESPLTYDVGLLGGIPTSVSGATVKRLAASGVIDRRRAYRMSRKVLAPTLRGGENPGAFTDVLRSWSSAGPEVVILDEPFVSDRLARITAVREIAARGACVLIVSSRPADIAASADLLLLSSSGSLRDVVPLSRISSESLIGQVLRARLRKTPPL